MSDPKGSLCVCSVTKLCLILCDPVDCSQPGSSVHGIFQVRTGVGYHFLLQGDFLTHRMESKSHRLQADSLPPEPAWVPKGVIEECIIL